MGAAMHDTMNSQAQYPESEMDENQRKEQDHSKNIRSRLDENLSYFEWQGASNRHARVQYLMTLLEEAIRVLAPPMTCSSTP